MSSQFWVGVLVPPLIKWVNPYLKKFFKLNEFDDQTKERITSKQYPFYYSFLYTLWVLILLGTGIAELLFMIMYGQGLFPQKSFAVLTLVGLINMIGVWLIFGALLDYVFLRLSPENFRDYVRLKQFKSGWNYEISQQIATLFKIGLVYYLVTFPLQMYLLFFQL